MWALVFYLALLCLALSMVLKWVLPAPAYRFIAKSVVYTARLCFLGTILGSAVLIVWSLYRYA